MTVTRDPLLDLHRGGWNVLSTRLALLRRDWLDRTDEAEQLLAEAYASARAIQGKTPWPAEEAVYEFKTYDQPLNTIRDVASAAADSTLEGLMAATSRKWWAETMGPRHPNTLSTIALLEERALWLYRASRTVQGKPPWPDTAPTLEGIN